MQAELDHLVVAASSLQMGSEYVADLLGVGPVMGGRHCEEGTHNRLLRLGARVYLEVIAIDPEASPSRDRRWFSLDAPDTIARLGKSPCLITWVARTDSIANLTAVPSYKNCEVIARRRDQLRWWFSCTPDGELLGDGLLPLIIQWDGIAHPADNLPNAGCELCALKGDSKQPTRVLSALSMLGLTGSLQLVEELPGGASLEAEINTPRGRVLLR